MELRILEVIAYEHDITGHTGIMLLGRLLMVTDSHYYEIVKEEVCCAIKKCQICARKTFNRSRGPLTPILVNDLFKRVQVDLIDFRDTPDGQYKWVLHAKDHFSKYTIPLTRQAGSHSGKSDGRMDMGISSTKDCAV